MGRTCHLEGSLARDRHDRLPTLVDKVVALAAPFELGNGHFGPQEEKQDLFLHVVCLSN